MNSFSRRNVTGSFIAFDCPKFYYLSDCSKK